MRRFLVLTLTLALGLTALAAVPAAAGTRSDSDDDCTYVWTRDGRECLTKLEIRQLGDRDTNRDKDTTKDRVDNRDKDGNKDTTKDRDNDRKKDSNKNNNWDSRKDTNKNTNKDRDKKSDNNRYTNRGFNFYWFRFVRSRTDDSCGCLTTQEKTRLLRRTVDPNLKEKRRILRYMYRQGCFTASEFRRHRRDARDYGGAELRSIIRNTGDCKCTSQGRYQLTSRDIRRLAQDMNLSQRSIRRLLGVKGDQGCVSSADFRRLDRRVSGVDFRDIFDILDWRGSL